MQVKDSLKEHERFCKGFCSSAYRERAIRELSTLSTSAQISVILVGIRDQFQFQSASAFVLSQLSTRHDQQ